MFPKEMDRGYKTSNAHYAWNFGLYQSEETIYLPSKQSHDFVERWAYLEDG